MIKSADLVDTSYIGFMFIEERVQYDCVVPQIVKMQCDVENCGKFIFFKQFGIQDLQIVSLIFHVTMILLYARSQKS